MKKIIEINDIPKILPNLKSKKIILAGGCFDILHSGHINFLNNTKKIGDALIVLLESDEKIKKIKGENRPINSQEKRSLLLSTLTKVDYIIMLKGVTKNEEYDKLIVQIKPDFIAITKNDKGIEKRKMQCEMIGAKLIIIKKYESPSTSDLIKLL